MNIVSQKEPLIIKQVDLVQAALAVDPLAALTDLYWETVRGTGVSRSVCRIYAELHTQQGVRIAADGYLTLVRTPTNERVRVVS